MQTNIYIPIDTQINRSVYCSKLIKRGDILTLQLKIFNNGVLADLTGQTIDLILKKADGTIIEKTITSVVDGVITAKLDIQATVVAGVVQGEAQIRDVNGQTSTNTFSFIVKNSIADDVLAKSQDDIEVIQDIRALLQKYDTEVQIIGGTTNQIEQLNNVKSYIDTNLPALENKNSEAVANNNILQSSIITAKSSKSELDNTNTTANNKTVALQQEITIAEDKLDEFRLYDPNNLIKQVQDNSSQLSNIQNEVLSNTFTKISTDAPLTKLESVKDGFVDGMVIEGKTLQNVIGSFLNRTITKNTGSGISIRLLKPSTKYTLIVDCGNAIDITNEVFLKLDYYDNTTQWLPFHITNPDATYLKNRRITYSFTTKNVDLKSGGIGLNTGNLDTASLEVKGLMILEGELKEVPSYFEGIKSTGELNDNKIEVLSSGKNLIGFPEKGDLDDYGNTIESDIYYRTKIIPVESNGSYILSGASDTKLKVCFFNKDKILTRKMYDTFSFTTNANELYVRMRFSYSENLQFEQSTIATKYQAPDKTTILMPNGVPLRGLPNGVRDRIDIEKGEVTRNLVKNVWNSNESWVFENTATQGNTILFRLYVETPNPKPAVQPICDKFIPSKTDLWGVDYEGIHKYYTGHNFFIRINKSKLTSYGFVESDTTTYIPSFKSWLQANPTTVYYELAEPLIEKLDNIAPLKTFSDGYIELDNAITPVVSFNYSTDLSSIIGKTTEIVDTLADRIASLESLVLTHIADIS